MRIRKCDLDGMIVWNEKGQCRAIIQLVNEKGERWMRTKKGLDNTVFEENLLEHYKHIVGR